MKNQWSVKTTVLCELPKISLAADRTRQKTGTICSGVLSSRPILVRAVMDTPGKLLRHFFTRYHYHRPICISLKCVSAQNITIANKNYRAGSKINLSFVVISLKQISPWQINCAQNAYSQQQVENLTFIDYSMD